MQPIHLHYRSALFLTNLLENSFKVGKKRIGLDPLIGLIPVWGDLIGLILSSYIVWIALQAKVPQEKISQMLGNIAFDFMIGLIPIFGDIADFAFKANSKNMKILEEFLPEEIFEAKTA